MSRLKLSSNLFLEVNELQRFSKFIDEDGWKQALKSFITKFGIVQNSSNEQPFLVQKVSSESSRITVNSGLAYDSDLNAIVIKEPVELNISNVGQTRWLILSYGVSNIEDGTVNIDSDGTIIGLNTEFTKVLRGQPNFPTKIKFESENNKDEYEVVSVESDTSAVISGILVAENNIKYSVIGTFTPGFIPSDEKKKIYEYDSYTLSIVDSATKPKTLENEIILCEMNFDSNGILNIIDHRSDFFNDSQKTSILNTDDSLNSFHDVVNLKRIDVVSANDKYCCLNLNIEKGYQLMSPGSQGLEKDSNGMYMYTLPAILNNYINNVNDIPDNFFSGWLFYNTVTYKSAKIDYNIGNKLYFSYFDESILTVINIIQIIPDCEEIELVVNTIGTNLEDDVIEMSEIKKISTTCNPTSINIQLFVPFPKINIDLRLQISYRLLSSNGKRSATFYPSNAPYIDIDGNIKTPTTIGGYNINIFNHKPNTVRNYS